MGYFLIKNVYKKNVKDLGVAILVHMVLGRVIVIVNLEMTRMINWLKKKQIL